MSWTDHDPPPGGDPPSDQAASDHDGGRQGDVDQPGEDRTDAWRPPWAQPPAAPGAAEPAAAPEPHRAPGSPGAPEPAGADEDEGAPLGDRPTPTLTERAQQLVPPAAPLAEPSAPPDVTAPTAPPTAPQADQHAQQPQQPTGGVWTTSRDPRPGGDRARRPAQVIALANQKGGVGKTTTVINLGAGLAELDQRVLLVDMDPQGSLGLGLGAEPHRLERTIYNLLMADGTSPDDVILESTQPGMHVIPANIDLAAAELMLVQEVAREQSLRRVLDRLLYRYDQILIDCPPSLGLLTINGLTAADSVIVPLECEYFALRGMALLMNTIEKVQGRLNPRLDILGILATMVDTRTLHAREVLERVHEAFGELVFKTTISRTIRFAEAPVAGEPITRYDSENRGADAYRDLAREVLARVPEAR